MKVFVIRMQTANSKRFYAHIRDRGIAQFCVLLRKHDGTNYDWFSTV